MSQPTQTKPIHTPARSEPDHLKDWRWDSSPDHENKAADWRTNHPCSGTTRSICTLAQQDAAVAARRLPGPTACMISGCWGLPVCKNAATAHSFRLHAVQRLFLCRRWIPLGDGLAIQISRLVAGPFLLCCLHCAVRVGLSKREGAHLLTKTTTVVQ